VWAEFFAPPGPGTTPPTTEELVEQYTRFRDALAVEGSTERLEQMVAAALSPFEQQGLIDKLPQEPNEGNQQEIEVFPKGQPGSTQVVKVDDVLIGQAGELRKRLAESMESPVVVERVFQWLQPRLQPTLTLAEQRTQEAIQLAIQQVGTKYTTYAAGQVLAKGGEPLGPENVALLRLEHETLSGRLAWHQQLVHSLATLGMYIALSILCGVYVYYYERSLLQDLRKFTSMLALVVGTVGLGLLARQDDWRAEIIPLLLFGMTVSIAYHQELALLLSAAVAIIFVMAAGQGLEEFIIWTAGVAASILLVGRVRSRKKLIYVGMAAGLVTFLTTIGVQTLDGQPFVTTLLSAARYGLWGVVAGFLMAGLLPFIESLFGVLTEISLLELGDVAHPLLQELVRRAPGTYNHSINVASMGEAAAESIGCKGLLVRVGAYFHDIGKMLKPGYFIENQGQNGNRHEALVPAMSTLIIIAHIKDGADLARQHHLPEPIIDMIQQHHGTTLVEYFYHRASQQSEANPDGGEVPESAFRYPGPKPQTKESAVLMLADAVESACRALVEPTPARIESLVHEIAMKRMLDGQFDACALTLQELATLEDSLVKSLTAVYHGRVKYPERPPVEQRTA
jgi:hypothetical protein